MSATSRKQQSLLVGTALLTLGNAIAIPGPTPVPAKVEARAPLITPPVRYMQDRRDVVDGILSGANNVLHSLGSVLGTDLPSYVMSGIPNYFQDLPTGTQVLSRLGIDDSDLAAKPTEVLNIPPYANWTDQGWNVRFHGNVYKQPDIDQNKVDDLANIFLIDTDIKSLPPDQQAQARNLTRSIFIVQQGNQNVSMHLEPAPMQGSSGEPGGGNSIEPPGGSQDLTLPYLTTDQGDFDVFVPIKNVSGGGLLAGNETNNVQRLNVYANGTLTGNATAFLVPPNGLTFISDIDDILRVTKIYDPKEGLLNSFARPFTPWMNMPDIYANWSRTLPNDTHFHYLTTTPEQATRLYMDFIYKTYPGGSFDTRPLNFSDVSATLSIRGYLLTKIFQTFPRRKFILVADTSNSDIMTHYPQLAHDYPNQVQCIFIRNTSATDESNKFPYNTKGFKGLPQQKYMFFKVPDDLRGLDIVNGNCWNQTIKQNVTFGLQDEVLGIRGEGTNVKGSALLSLFVAFAVAVMTVW
ncbi:uncharacterized protein EI97DRAFT_434703 [Westerdykella ornata]|uniref:Phosphatidate phosphatase APP1 catalytic domain-containing protein n=1 Tax=Westerdykella ornata TaxID=318751 RepID=A0A6A6JE13_WESOR|nr:uncharacterized protein EI97DRAFT_434703 [Westerdykella ornata]KAF2274801.1 hypothetical protein EI97DRAFT_434703 [Westerdykella ornata]